MTKSRHKIDLSLEIFLADCKHLLANLTDEEIYIDHRSEEFLNNFEYKIKELLDRA